MERANAKTCCDNFSASGFPLEEAADFITTRENGRKYLRTQIVTRVAGFYARLRTLVKNRRIITISYDDAIIGKFDQHPTASYVELYNLTNSFVRRNAFIRQTLRDQAGAANRRWIKRISGRRNIRR